MPIIRQDERQSRRWFICIRDVSDRHRPMDMLQPPPNRYLPGGRGSENEIREIFYKHGQRMNANVETIINQIYQWRNDSMDKIHRYADEQVALLRNDYNQQQAMLENCRRQNIDTAVAYANSREDTSPLFTQLRDECQKLTFQLASLETIKENLAAARVLVIEDRQRSESNTLMTSVAMLTLKPPLSPSKPVRYVLSQSTCDQLHSDVFVVHSHHQRIRPIL